LQGDRSAIAVNDVQQFRARDDTAAILESLDATSPDRQMATAGKDAFAALRLGVTLQEGGRRVSAK
jgi:hypothetical protein